MGERLVRDPSLDLAWGRDGGIVLLDVVTGEEHPVAWPVAQLLAQSARPWSPTELLERMEPDRREGFERLVASVVGQGWLVPATDHRGTAPLPRWRAVRPYPPRRGTVGESFASPSVHRLMLEDERRVAAFLTAIEEGVRPGDTVVDLGAGCGLLSVAAARAGAGRVIAIEGSDLASVIRGVADASGVGDRIEVHEAWSTEVELPHRADLVVSETLGHLGLDEGLLAVADDARRRLLARGGTFLPDRIRLLAAPVALPSFHAAEVDGWRRRPWGLETGSLARRAVEATYLVALDPEDLLGPPVEVAEVEVGAPEPDPVGGRAVATVATSGALAGIGVWFAARLGSRWLDAFECSSWFPVFLPAPAPCPVAAGDEVAIELELTSDGGREVWRWAVGIRSAETQSFGARVVGLKRP